MIAVLGVLAVLLLLCGFRFGLRGLQQLAFVRIQVPYLPLVAGLLQMVSMATNSLRWFSVFAAAGCFMYFAYRNRHCPGMALILVGVLLNFSAMLANNGMMPLHPEALAQRAQMVIPEGSSFAFSRNLVSADSTSALAWLGDRFVLPGIAARIAVWSLGDAVLIAGVLVFLWRTMSGVLTIADQTDEPITA